MAAYKLSCELDISYELERQYSQYREPYEYVKLVLRNHRMFYACSVAGLRNDYITLKRRKGVDSPPRRLLLKYRIKQNHLVSFVRILSACKDMQLC